MKFNNKTVNAIFISILLIMLLTSSSCSSTETFKDKCAAPIINPSSPLIDTEEIEYEPVSEYKPKYDKFSDNDVTPYDSLFEDNVLNLKNPVESNNSIYGQNNLSDFFEIRNNSVPIKYQFKPDEDVPKYFPSETILNVDDNKYSVTAADTDSHFKFEGYSPDNYAQFAL